MKAQSGRKGWLLVLFIAPFIAMLWPPFYNFTEPRMIGIPFFYWFQLLWILITAVITLVVYLAGPREKREGRTS